VDVVVVNNTDSNLTNTDTFNDGETSITANPANPNEIVITAFSGSWGKHAPLWQSTDGGSIWTKRFTIPAPPSIATDGCPGDQTIDYGMPNQMSGTFLISDIFSGITTNRASPPAWNWLVIGGVTQATNFNNSPPPSFVDQPWLLVNADPMIPTWDNVYAAYDDSTNNSNCTGDACNMRVSVSYGVNPPDFTVHNQSGTTTGSINPGHRLAVDPRNGSVYSLFQRNIGAGAGGSKNIDYMQMKAVGTCFYGAFTGNGVPFGRPFANHDPIFFRACVGSEPRPTPTPRPRQRQRPIQRRCGNQHRLL
jgi:hypothetical protein